MKSRGDTVVDKELFNKFVEWRKGIQTIGKDSIFYYKDQYIIEVSTVDGLDTLMIIWVYNKKLDIFETVSNKEYIELIKDSFIKKVIN